MQYVANTDLSELLDAQPVGRFHLKLLAVCFVALLFDGFDTQAIGYVGPAIAKAWSLPNGALGPVFGAGLTGLMIGALGFGPLADRFGRKAIIATTMFVFGVCTLATARADSLHELMVWRFLAGLGLGGAMPNAIALMAEFAPRRRRATLNTILVCGFSIGAAVGGFLAERLIPASGWRSVLYVGGAGPLLLLPLIVLTLPESVRFLASRGAPREKIATVLARLEPRLGSLEALKWDVPREAITFPVKHLFMDGRAMATTLIWLSIMMNLIVLYFFASWLPTMLVSAGLPSSTAVRATAYFQVGGTVGALVIGWLVDHISPTRVLGGAFLCAAVSIAITASGGVNVGVVLPAVFFAGFCIVGGQLGANAFVGGFYPTRMRATGVGWALGVGRVGSVIGPVVAGCFLAWGWQPDAVFHSAVVPAALAGIAMVAVGQSVRKHETEPAPAKTEAR
ncbi:MFS transporter [Burkholderia multivorans]|uniref:MFS transporter n=1 Tax=Burkholderia multivorans TaxID=87883 RepID=UPI00159130D4|nr:MFS transporter [Burkholderia multivorans]MDN8008977.1 MFS transporter [Burkholderia multivorans]